MFLADTHTIDRAMKHRHAARRQPMLLCALIALAAVAVYLWTAPARAERRLQAASLSELEAETGRDASAPRPAYYLGVRRLQLGDVAAAHAAFEQAAHHASDDEPSWLGYAATTTGPEAAQDSATILAGYLKLHTESEAAHLALGQAYRRGTAHAAAYREATLAAQLAPGDTEAWKLVGSEAAAQGRLPEAIAALQKAVDLQPLDWHTQAGQGEMLLQVQRREEGLARLQAAARMAPDEPGVWQMLAQNAVTVAERAEARQAGEAAQTAAKRRPRPAPAVMDRLPGQVGTLALLRDADALLLQNRLPEAQLAYLAILNRDPGAARAYQGAGLTLAAQGERANAFLLLVRATEIDAHLWRAQFTLGNWLLAADFKKEAARRLTLAVADAPRNAACWHALGRACSGLDVQNRQAEDAYRRAVELEPDNVPALLDFAEMLAVNNRMDKADQVYRHALQLAPHNADALSRLGGFLLDTRPTTAGLDEALRLLNAAVRVDPDSDFAWYQLGRLASLRGDDSAAISALQHAVKIAPQVAESWYALSRALLRHGDRRQCDLAMGRFRRLRALDQERAHTAELLDLHPRQYVLHLRLARLYALNAEYAKAIFEYTGYLEFRPQDAGARKELTELQRQLKAKGQLPVMALFSAMVALSLRHAPTQRSERL